MHHRMHCFLCSRLLRCHFCSQMSVKKMRVHPCAEYDSGSHTPWPVVTMICRQEVAKQPRYCPGISILRLMYQACHSGYLGLNADCVIESPLHTQALSSSTHLSANRGPILPRSLKVGRSASICTYCWPSLNFLHHHFAAGRPQVKGAWDLLLASKLIMCGRPTPSECSRFLDDASCHMKKSLWVQYGAVCC